MQDKCILTNNKICKLREITEDDYRFVYELVDRFLKTDLSVTFLKLPDYEEFVKTYFVNDYKRYIVTNDNSVRLGFVVITKDDEIGYFLSPEYEGKGIALDAVKQLIELNPRERYFATIHNKNKRSINLITKLGFYPKGTIYEGIRNKH